MFIHPRCRERAGLLVLLLALPATYPPGFAATLAEIVQQAVERRPQARVNAARSEVGAGYLRQSSQLLGGQPQGAVSHLTDQIGSDQGLRETEAYVELPLWLPGQRDARRELGERTVAEASAGYERLRWEVSEQVRERAWSLRLAEAERTLAVRHLESARAFEGEIRRRKEAGELAEQDLLLARQETLQREAMYAEAVGLEQRARAAWQSYTGLDQLPVDLEREPLSQDALNDRHPLLAAAGGVRERQRALRDDTRISHRENPLLKLGAKRQRGSDADSYVNSLGAEIKIPFGGAGLAAPAIAEAEAALTEAEAAYAETHHDLELELEQQHIALKQAENGLELAEQRNRLAQQGLHLAERAFALGESNLRTLLLAREDAAGAALDLERRRLERLRAIARYNQSLGVIPQ
jgi:outer membrane protein TolC